MKKIRTAVVGCGRVSRTAHYDAITKNKYLKLVAICDIDKERANYWGKQLNVKAYYNIKQLLQKENLDLLSVTAPSGLHFELAMEAAEKGVHVIVEKPLAMTSSDAQKLISFCEKKGVKLFVVLQNRYNRTNALLKDCIANGRFGKIHLIHVNLLWSRGIDYYTEDQGWRSKKDMAGGVFTNQAIHYIDMLQWLVDSSPTTAYAQMANDALPVEVEQYGAGIITFENGVIASLALSSVAFPDDLEGSITISGEKGIVRIDGKSMNKISIWRFSDPIKEDQEIQKTETSPLTVYGYGHFEFYRRVGEYLSSGKSDNKLIDGKEGLKSVELLEALYLSDMQNEQIELSII